MTPELQTIIKKISLQPIGNRLLVYPDTADDMTKSGLHIPDTAKERPQTGFVLKAGAKCSSKPGQHILFGRYAGFEMEHNEVKFLIMREDDVAAILI